MLPVEPHKTTSVAFSQGLIQRFRNIIRSPAPLFYYLLFRNCTDPVWAPVTTAMLAIIVLGPTSSPHKQKTEVHISFINAHRREVSSKSPEIPLCLSHLRSHALLQNNHQSQRVACSDGLVIGQMHSVGRTEKENQLHFSIPHLLLPLYLRLLQVMLQ